MSNLSGEDFPLITEKVDPDSRVEQDKKREKFQTSGNHIKHENNFRKDAKTAKILRRSNQLQTGSHVIDRGKHSGKIGN